LGLYQTGKFAIPTDGINACVLIQNYKNTYYTCEVLIETYKTTNVLKYIGVLTDGSNNYLGYLTSQKSKVLLH